jgi:acyl carrier protein phosphodiesterase
MNFLGHFYLSHHDSDLLVGNFIADFVKGKKYLDYPPGIAAGIMMHRKIDYFTDHHKLVSEGRKRLFSKYRHYSGVIIDMYYDHFLSNLWSDYSEHSLSSFSARIYKTIEVNFDVLPERAQFLFPYMKNGNWLMRYASTEGIGQSLTGMSKRIKHDSKLDESIHELHEYYDMYKEEFQQFIIEIKDHFNT